MRKVNDDMEKKKCFIILLSILLIGVVGLTMLCSYQKTSNKEKEERFQEQFEDYAEKQQKEKYIYPQEENGNGISINYTSKILTQESKGTELSKYDDELIVYRKIQEDGLGYAATKYYENDEGMGKASRRTWKTIDNGETWNVVNEEIYSTGYYSLVLMDSVLIESSFGMMSQKGYFRISTDFGETFEEIPHSQIYEYNGTAYPELVSQNEVRKTITYRWGDYHTQEAIATIEYNIHLEEIRGTEESK